MLAKFTLISAAFLLSVSSPAVAGTYTSAPNCNCERVHWENGVQVYRANPVSNVSPQAFALYNSRVAAAAQEKTHAASRAALQATQKRLQAQTYDRAYNHGYVAGQKGVEAQRRQNRARRNPYNYGRRYSTSFQNPRYARFRSNLSYGRPAYLQAYKLRD